MDWRFKVSEYKRGVLLHFLEGVTLASNHDSKSTRFGRHLHIVINSPLFMHYTTAFGLLGCLTVGLDVEYISESSNDSGNCPSP